MELFRKLVEYSSIMEKELAVQNVKCGGCANSINKGLTEIQGVTNVRVDHEHGIIAYTISDESLNQSVLDKLDKMGYPADPDQNTMLKKAKSYVSCMIGRISDQPDKEGDK